MGSVSQSMDGVTRSISTEDLENLILTKIVESINMHSQASSSVLVTAKLVKAELQKEKLERRANDLYRQIRELTKVVHGMSKKNGEKDHIKSQSQPDNFCQRFYRSVGLQVNIMPPVQTMTISSSSKNVPAATTTSVASATSTRTDNNNRIAYASKRVLPYSSNRVTGKPHLPPFPMNLKTTPNNNIPKPELVVEQKDNVVILTWKHVSESHPMTQLKSYKMFAFYESSIPNQNVKKVWRDIGTVNALPLPMSCTLTELVSGRRYHFSIRGIDHDNREGPCSNVVSAQVGI